MATKLHESPVYGPVMSRRLGRSLGINLSPADGKICNFDCIYCECGLNAERIPHTRFPPVEDVLAQLELRLKDLVATGTLPDALTFAGNGEPTLHPAFSEIVSRVIKLRNEILPRALICVLTNAMEIDRPDIRHALLSIDVPMLKLDAATSEMLKVVNRPQCPVNLVTLVERMRSFWGKAVIQTLFFDGPGFSNYKGEALNAWLGAVSRIRPRHVVLYTLARETPLSDLRPAPGEALLGIAAALKARGIEADCYL